MVLSDASVLRKICGVNDKNVARMEELFSAPVQVRGNELVLDSSQQEQQSYFVQFMEELQQCIRVGHEPDPGLLDAVYRQVTTSEGDSDLLRRTAVVLPVGNVRVFPRSPGQVILLNSLRKNALSFLIGPAGTGKTFLAVAHALQELLSKRKRKLVLTRPVVEAGESLGYLPGDLTQKINPYLRPLYDAIESLLPPDMVRRLYEQHLIEIAPLAYMRGRSLRDCYIILDEAQNTTQEQMKMFLTRLGENSAAAVTGDITQVDLPRRHVSGLAHAASILTGLEEIETVYLTREDVVRSALVKRIVQAYEENG